MAIRLRTLCENTSAVRGLSRSGDGAYSYRQTARDKVPFYRGIQFAREELDKKEAQVDRTISALKEIGVQNIGVSHCTGLNAAMKLKAAFGDRFFFNNAGSARVIE